MKQNCWEFKKCSKMLNGSGKCCPAYSEARLDQVHGGHNAGRACWLVVGTFCGGTIQGNFAKKYENCEKCDFYRKVKEEERETFQLSATLLAKIR